jgi:hypothetical protein
MTLLALLLACPTTDDSPSDDSSTDDSAGDSEVITPPTDCEVLGLPEADFDATEPESWYRHQPAGDFTVSLRDGTDWTLSENWSGCDNYVFLPHYFSLPNGDSWWTTGIDELLARSDKNVHYFFVVAGLSSGDAEEYGSFMQTEVESTLANLSEEDQAWWSDRLHVVEGPSLATEGITREMFKRDVGIYGFGIDRYQKIRTLGNVAAVEAYNQSEDWPWEDRLYSSAVEATYWNFEWNRDQEMALTDWTRVSVVTPDEIQAQYVDAEIEIPDVSGFDTLQLDVRIECPERSKQEIGNCGAWDYLAHAWLYDETTESWFELGRFITTYHRESRWVVDATHAIPWLEGGGTRTLRFSWAPSWNTQPSFITFDLLLADQGKGLRPVETIPLWTGGGLNSTYNENHAPISVDVPADAARVDLVAITTGHGMDTSNCAEFCDHSHHFTVGAETWDQEFPEVGQDDGCSTTVHTGTVPNQAGTWWFGRGGWCPGRRVDPWTVDVTAQLNLGEANDFGYQAQMNNKDPIDNLGNIEMRTWAVVYR